MLVVGAALGFRVEMTVARDPDTTDAVWFSWVETVLAKLELFENNDVVKFDTS